MGSAIVVGRSQVGTRKATQNERNSIPMAGADRQGEDVPDSGEFGATHLPRGEVTAWSGATGLMATWDLAKKIGTAQSGRPGPKGGDKPVRHPT